MKVWLVGIEDCESNIVRYVCLSERTAEMRWNELRLELIRGLNKQLEYNPMSKIAPRTYTEDVQSEIQVLSKLDPKYINNYPHKQPYIREMECQR